MFQNIILFKVMQFLSMALHDNSKTSKVIT